MDLGEGKILANVRESKTGIESVDVSDVFVEKSKKIKEKKKKSKKKKKEKKKKKKKRKKESENKKKKKAKTGGKKCSEFKPNSNSEFNAIVVESQKKSFKNFSKQYRENILPKMEKLLRKRMPDDFRAISLDDLREENAIETFATSARLLENRKASGGLELRCAGDILRYSGFVALFNRFCLLWKNAKTGRVKPNSDPLLARRAAKAMFEIAGKSETIKRPTIAPTSEEMKQIMGYLNKEDTLKNLESRILIALATHLELRTGLTLKDVSPRSFKFDDLSKCLLFQKRNTKNFKLTQGQVKVIFEKDAEDFCADLRAYLLLRDSSLTNMIRTGEISKDEAAELPLILQFSNPNAIVKDVLEIESLSFFKPKPMTFSKTRTWFVDIAEEAKVEKAREKFENKSIRCFVAAVQNENGISNWKRKDIVNIYDRKRSKFQSAVAESLKPAN